MNISPGGGDLISQALSSICGVWEVSSAAWEEKGS